MTDLLPLLLIPLAILAYAIHITIDRNKLSKSLSDLQFEFSNIERSEQSFECLNELFKTQTTELQETRSSLLQIKDDYGRLNVEKGSLESKNRELFGKQKSEQVRLGQVSENIMPFLKDFGYDSKQIRGLFSPIDLIVFGTDELVFVELKTGKAKLSPKQKNIKRLVDEKKVRFEIHRLDENGYTKE